MKSTTNSQNLGVFYIYLDARGHSAADIIIILHKNGTAGLAYSQNSSNSHLDITPSAFKSILLKHSCVTLTGSCVCMHTCACVCVGALLNFSIYSRWHVCVHRHDCTLALFLSRSVSDWCFWTICTTFAMECGRNGRMQWMAQITCVVWESKYTLQRGFFHTSQSSTCIEWLQSSCALSRDWC